MRHAQPVARRLYDLIEPIPMVNLLRRRAERGDGGPRLPQLLGRLLPRDAPHRSAGCRPRSSDAALCGSPTVRWPRHIPQVWDRGTRRRATATVAPWIELGAARSGARADPQALASLTDDFDSVVAASRDTNADDEHDPEGATIAFERSQVAALVRHARAAPSRDRRRAQARWTRGPTVLRVLRATHQRRPTPGEADRAHLHRVRVGLSAPTDRSHRGAGRLRSRRRA